MSGFQLVIDASDLGRVSRRLGRISQTVGDTAPLITELSDAVEEQTLYRFDVEKQAPDGTDWADWSPNYDAPRHGGHSKLVDTDELKLSISSKVIPGVGTFVGTNLVYAAIHQFGGDGLHWSSGGAKDIPARPFMGISDANYDELGDIVEHFFARSLS